MCGFKWLYTSFICEIGHAHSWDNIQGQVVQSIASLMSLLIFLLKKKFLTIFGKKC